MIMGQRGRDALPLCRASSWILRISRTQCSSVAAIAWCMLWGSLPSTKIRGVPVTDEQRLQFLVADASQDGGIVDLVSIEVKDRQDCPVGDRIEKFVAVPACCQGPGLGLAVAHHNQRDQVRVVVGRPVSVGDAIAEFAPFMDAAGRFWGSMAANAAGE